VNLTFVCIVGGESRSEGCTKTKYMVMSRHQNAGRSHNIKTDNSYLEKWNSSDIWEQQIKILFRNKLRAVEVRECLISFGAESFVFQFTIQKYKDEDLQNYNFAYCFVWM